MTEREKENRIITIIMVFTFALIFFALGWTSALGTHRIQLWKSERESLKFAKQYREKMLVLEEAAYHKLLKRMWIEDEKADYTP